MTTAAMVGLGHMGSPLAANLYTSGVDLLTHDVAGAAGSPPGARFVDSLAEVAAGADVVALSLPDGAAAETVATAIADASSRRVGVVINLSTTGPAAAARLTEVLGAVAVAHVDAAVSGGPGGARDRTLMIMYAGDDAACIAAEPVLAALSDRRRRVGDRPGMAQAMKLVNNLLAATALAATSEAIAFGLDSGLDLDVMLDVLNASSGRNDATVVKFPRQVATGRYQHGFSNTLMAKDVALYLDEVTRTRGPSEIATTIEQVWNRFATDQPDADFTRIFPYLRSEADQASP